MKVLLVYPEYTEIYGDFRPAAKLGVVYPPLGLMYLASSLEKEGHQVKILDMEVEGLTKDSLTQYLGQWRPDVVGTTSMTPTHHKAAELLAMVKKFDSSITTIAGGPHPTALPLQTMQDSPEVDMVVWGEAETTFTELVNGLERGSELSKIPSVYYRKDGKVHANVHRPLEKDLDQLPHPARHLVNQEKYLWSVPKKGVIPVTPFETARGCPFQCTFCSQFVVFGNRLRERSIPNVIEEMQIITEKHNINHLVFYDDTLGLNKKRAVEMCDAMIKEKIDITFEGMTRVHVVTRELLDKMIKAGLNRLSFGVESGNQDILNAVKKGIRLDQIRDAYKLAHEMGLETRMSLIFGLPGETKETVRKTIDFIKSLDCYQAYINIGTPFPGTEYYEQARRGVGGIRMITEDWRQFRRWGNAVIEVNDLKKDDLIRMQKRAMLEFYLRPKQILYNLRRAGVNAAARNMMGFLKSYTPKFGKNEAERIAAQAGVEATTATP